MSSRRPPRGPGGPGRAPANAPSGGGPEDTPAQTNLGLLLQRALEAAQQSAQPAQAEVAAEPEQVAEAAATKLCANCWNALTFKDERGRHMARCAKNLWVKPSVSVEDLNSNKVRRWYGDCPEYDDSE